MEFVTLSRRRAHCRTTLATLVLLAISIPLAIGEEPKTDTAPGAAVPSAEGTERSAGASLFDIPVHGFVSVQYRGRWTGDDEDNDGYGTLGLDIGDSARQPLTFHFLGRGAADLDGEQDKTGHYVFDSVSDTYDSPVTGQVYSAHLDVHTLDYWEVVRVGRQSIEETPEVAFFDGARVETEELADLSIKLGAYGGVPVHLYESSPGGDALLGAYGQCRPWVGGRVRLDAMVAEDETLLGGNYSNTLFGVAGWQELARYFEMHLKYTRLDGSGRDYFLRGMVRVPEHDFMAQISYYELLNPRTQYALEFEPYFASSQDLFPYCLVRGLVSKGFGDHLVVESGVDVRKVWDDEEIGDFNREFERYHLTVSVLDLPVERLGFSATGEIWDSPARETSAVGGEVSYECTGNVKTAVGTSYSLYHYDYLLDRERDDVRTYYARMTYKLTEHLTADARYEFEEDDFEQYHQLRIGLRWTF